MCISGQTAFISARAWNSSVNKSIRRIDFSENDRQCMLVIIGADEWGNKDVLGLIDGFRKSTQSWRKLLLDLKRRGLEMPPKLAFGMGPWGSGRRCTRFMARPAFNSTGSTRRQTY